LVAQGHDFVFFGVSGDLEVVVEVLGIDDEGVVAHGGEGVFEAGEYGLAVVGDLGGFAMHATIGADDFGAVGFGDALAAEADAEDGDFSGPVVDDPAGVAGFVWGAGARGEDQVGRLVGLEVRAGDGVVAEDDDPGLGGQDGDGLDEVVGERVIIVDYYYFGHGDTIRFVGIFGK